MVFGLDSNFSEEALVDRYNADLANDLGNLVSRSTRMVSKYFDGVLPEPGEDLKEEENELKALALRVVGEYRDRMENLEMHTAMASVWSLVSGLNKYIDYTAPWNLAKDDPARLALVMYHVMEGLRYVAEMIFPVMPATSKAILDILGVQQESHFKDLERFGKLRPGTKIASARALFPRVEKIVKTQEAPVEAPQDNLLDISDFAKVEIRVGRIVEAARVDKSDKLLVLQVDVGRKIQIAAGIAQSYSVEELVGKDIAVVTNLKPAKLMGIASEGMLLATDTAEGRLSLVTFDRAPKVGSKIR